MTEQELIDLRDSLIGFDATLTALDLRVTAVENNASPKGEYFQQLTASFADSPACCECETPVVPDCNCTNAVHVMYLQADSDNLIFKWVTLEINGVIYSVTDSDDIRSVVPDTLVTLNIASVYMFTDTDQYSSTVYYLRIANQTSESLCIRMTSVTDSFIDAYVLDALTIPTEDEFAVPLHARTEFDLQQGTDFTYPVNPTLAQGTNNSVASNTVTFCLAALP